MSMEQENKELLLKSLCARLPHGVKVNVKYYDDACKLQAVYADGIVYATRDIDHSIETYFEECKPYLFPLSSMTEDQRELRDEILDSYNSMEQCYIKLIDWYNKNHFDYMNLIPKGLAIDCTNLNIY